jgi:hypothetical protein
MEYIGAWMSWSVEYTDEFGEWYTTLIEAIQDNIARVVGLLEAKGPQLPLPLFIRYRRLQTRAYA